MALFQVVPLIWLLLCLPTAETNESFMLQNSWEKLCLTHVLPDAARGTTCDQADPNQQWRWIDGLFLQNVASGQCVTTTATNDQYEMQDCIVGSDAQRMICSYNTIKGSHRGKTTAELGIKSGSFNYRMSANGNRKRARWNVFGDSEKSICNGKNFRENRKWWRVTGNAMDVSSGLTPLILFTTTAPDSTSNFAVMDSSGNFQIVYGHLESISAAPYGVWGLQGDQLWQKPQSDLRSPGTWIDFGLGYTFADFTMLEKGFFVKGGDFCARLGITEDIPAGDNSNCVPSPTPLEDFSCGVTGCFGLVNGILHFRDGVTTHATAGTGWSSVGNPQHELFVKIEAGPIYELWAITSDGYPYRRLGMSDSILNGTHWEQIPNLLLQDVSFGIYGPVAIAKDRNIIMFLNGSPAPIRQREMDDYCTSAFPACTYPGDTCQNAATICNARYTPSAGDSNHAWRCSVETALTLDGQVWKDDIDPCLYSSHDELLPIALRYPVLGDFEKQLWLDTFCRNQHVSGCSQEYFAKYNSTSQELVCRTMATTSSCPVRTGLHDGLLNLTTGSCADNPLILQAFASSQFASSFGYGYLVKLDSNKEHCRKGYKVDADEYFTIDFLFRHKICAVATIGRDGFFVDEYRISYGVKHDVWNDSSLFGSPYVFKGNVDDTTLVKRYLPASIVARWFRVTFLAEVSRKKCIRIEVYGSSLETEATSCQDYKDHLSASLDGFYNIYPKETEIKKRVFCKGITDNEPTVEYPYEEFIGFEEIGCFRDNGKRAMPVEYVVDASDAVTQCKTKAHAAGYEVFAVQASSTECFTGPRAHITYDKYGEANDCIDGKGGPWANSVYRIIKADKLFWPLNTTNGGSPGAVIHGQQAVNVYQGSNTRALARFPNHCVTNLEFCGEGLSVEFWLWFTYTIGYHESGIITSGFGKDNSRGFKIFLKYHHVCMEIHMANTMYKACVGPLGKPTYWLHVLATWDVVDGITLLVDSLEMRSEGLKVGRYGERVDWDSVLRLGNRYASQTNSYEIAIHSLTIWARKLSEDEMEARFTKGYTLANEGESCQAACEAKGLACDRVMTADGNKVVQRLGFECSSTVPYNAADPAEPYMTSSGVCHGFSGSKPNCSCEVSKPAVRRLCRCERPVHGDFTQWTQWSFCSRTCGSGRRVRTRSCTHPAPRMGGNDCEGITSMHDDCQELPCGVEHGILHHIWQGNPDVAVTKADHIRSYAAYPMFSHVIEEFATKSNRLFYGERLITYFVPPESGDYKFIVECPHSCNFAFAKRSKISLLPLKNIVGLKTTTITDLVAGTLYYMAVSSVYMDGSNEFKLGFESIASGLVVNPITKQYLTWKAPTYQGVSRKVWDTRSSAISGYYGTTEFLENAGDPDIYEELTSFEAGPSGNFYVQELQSYFLATSSGEYNFYLTCAVECFLFIDDVYVGFWDKYGNINSKWSSGRAYTQTLEGGRFYKMVMKHYNTGMNSNYVDLGVTLPDATELKPIPSKYLWLTIPEKLEIELSGQISQQQPVSNAIDGLLSTCSMTTATTNPWFRLQSRYKFNVWSVVITNKVDSPADLDNVTVKVGTINPQQRDGNALCYTVAHIPAGQTVSYPCETKRSGTFVTVWLYGSNRILSLCEIVVYGERYRVAKGSYLQGTNDGRVERWQTSSSASMPRHDKDGIDFHHPYNSWCSKIEVEDKFFEVRFIERRSIVGVIIQRANLEEKWVTKAKIQYEDYSNNWVYARSNHLKDEFGGKGTLLFETAYYARSLRYIPTQWFHQPCVRMGIIGKQLEKHFAWTGSIPENSTRMKLMGSSSASQVGTLPAISVPRGSHIEFSGFSTKCLRNPKMCDGSFVIGVKVKISDVTTDGLLFSTSGHNTSVVGTSLFLKDSNLMVIIRTVSRIWEVSAPASSLVADTLKYFQIEWNYMQDIVLRIEDVPYSAPYTVVAPMPLSSEDTKDMITFGGVDLFFNWFSFTMESYDNWLRGRIHNAVDGWHTAEWSSWSYCSKSCGNSSVQYRYRSCTNPSPKLDGLECAEDKVRDTRACPKPSCESDDGVLREVWMNKRPPEFSLTNVFDGYASHLEVVADFTLTYNDGPFAERLRTFLHASESGNFEFRLSCAYQCELWISPNDEVEDKVRILSHDGSSNAEWSISTLTGNHDFESGENYYIEVRSFDIEGARNHTLLTIKAPGAAAPGTGFSLVRHKPDEYHGLGLESGAIPNGRFYPRVYEDYSQFAYYGRLNGDFPHCLRASTNERAFIVDLHELHWIVAVAVQGCIKNGTESWIRNFNFRTRLDLYNNYITDHDGVSTGYDGNVDAETVKVIDLVQPSRSRYVYFWLYPHTNGGCFRVDIIGRHAGNVAFLKETEQSGAYGNSYKAVDGLFKRLLDYCAHAGGENNMVWWVVDLGRSYFIGEVFFVGRSDCCLERMHDIQIRIGNSGGASSVFNPQCGGLYSLWEPQYIRSLSVYCEPYGYGRYLTIAKDDAASDMSFSEVTAFQIENDTIFSNWSDCSVTCGFGFQQRRTMCIKPYYCKSVEEVRPCFAGKYCEKLMQNCGQLHALGETESGPYKVRPNPTIENDIYIYCDHDTDDGGWLILQRRSSNGTLNMTQSWDIYRDGFGNVSTEFWIGNKYLSQLTNHTTYEIMFVFKRTNGSVFKKTKCDAFNVSTEEENFRLQLGTCQGPDAEVLKFSNWTEFSTWDKDNGFGSLNCTNDITGWWFGNCDSFINNMFLSCFGASSCEYEVVMMIKPNKVDGDWTHWTMWETCDKPCGGGNRSRVRSCTYPPPTGGGADCDGPKNETLGCNTSPCPDIEVNITMRFTDETWATYLLDPLLNGFQELVIKIRNNILALYDNNPAISVVVHRFRQGSVISDVTILYDALDGQQLVVLYEDLDQDGLLNEDMPVVYNHSETVVTEVLLGPPELTESWNTSSTSIYVKWQPPISDILYRLLGYRIFYKESNDTSLTMLVQSVEKNVREIEISDLNFYTNYSVRVCAFSSAGNGVPTSALHIMTDEHVPMAAPVITSAYNLSSTSLNISWLPVDLALFLGIPTGYILHYRMKTSDNTTAFLNTTIDDYLVTSINISDLMKYTEYEIYMTATTIKGQGIRGESVYIWTDEDIPSYPPGYITLEKNTSTSLLISWSAIPQEFVHGVLRGYVIEYWPVEHVNDSLNATVESWVTEVELTNLMKFSNYSIKFAGMTAKGVGNWSEVILQTAEDVPEWGPMNVTGFNISETEVNISWSLIPEEYRHGIIIGYRVYYQDDHRHSGSITVPASQRNVLLNGLFSYTLYNISIAGITRAGEGWKKTSALVHTNPGAPYREPWDLICSGVSSYTISLSWHRFTPGLTGSIITGYFISYKAVEPPQPTVYNVTVENFKYNYIAKGLKGYTNYSFEMYVFNPWGRSNTSTVVCRTEEGKPLASPKNLIAISKLAPDKVHLQWESVPDIDVAGVRRGYTVTYRKTKDAGEYVDGDEKIVHIFDPLQTEIVIEGLEYYSRYSFAIRVFNTMFYGDNSHKVYAETCNCLENFYMNWCSYMPYVNTSESGIFPPLIRSAIYGVCGNCSEYGEPRIHSDFNIVGASAKKSDLVTVRQSITDQNQINFPLIGRKDARDFVPIIDSPGSVFVTKKPSLTMAVEYMFFDTVIGTLPLLGFAVVTASLAGLIMWLLESGKNKEEFPSSFHRGAGEGFWWAFISMTTVGYGDRTPTTLAGRIFSIVWTLYGLVITGILVGNLTSALTASVAFTVNEVDLYQAKIAAIENSSEFKLGLLKGAHVNEEKDYSDILSALHAVEVGSVEGALLDMYVVASRPELQRKDSPLMVKTVIENPSAYGVVLSGHATKLRKPFLRYFQNNGALVSTELEKYTNPVKKSDESVDTSEVEGDEINVLAPDSPVIKQPLFFSIVALGVAIFFGLVAHFTLCKRCRKLAGMKKRVLKSTQNKKILFDFLRGNDVDTTLFLSQS